MMRTDDECMVSLRGGDESSFAQIVERWQGPLIGFFNRHLRDFQLGEDLSQDTLMRVHAAAGEYKPSGQFKAWIFRIARNLLIDSTRKRSHDVLVKSVRNTVGRHEDDRDDICERMDGHAADPCDSAEAKELVAIVVGVMDSVSLTSDDAATQLITLLDYCSGESLPAIAERRSLALPTVKSQKRLAIEKLQTLVMS